MQVKANPIVVDAPRQANLSSEISVSVREAPAVQHSPNTEPKLRKYSTEEQEIRSKVIFLRRQGKLHIPSMSAFRRPAPEASLYTVINFSTLVQRSFRRKLYGLLTLESLLSFLIALILYALGDVLRTVVTERVPEILAAFTFISLVVLYLVKHVSPWNYAAYYTFCLLKGAAVGFAAALGAISLLIYLGSFFLIALLLSLTTGIMRGREEPKLISIFQASFITWVIYVVIVCIVFITTGYFGTNDSGLLVANLILNTLLIAWFAFDGASLMDKCAVDEYMQGVTFFYTDVFLLILIAIVSMFSLLLILVTGEGGGAGFVCCELAVLSSAPNAPADRRRGEGGGGGY